MDGRLAFLVVMLVVVVALLVVPAVIEIALFRVRCWRVRRERDRTDHAVSPYRNGHGVSGRDRATQMYALSARVARMRVDHHDDAA